MIDLAEVGEEELQEILRSQSFQFKAVSIISLSSLYNTNCRNQKCQRRILIYETVQRKVKIEVEMTTE